MERISVTLRPELIADALDVEELNDGFTYFPAPHSLRCGIGNCMNFSDATELCGCYQSWTSGQ